MKTRQEKINQLLKLEVERFNDYYKSNLKLDLVNKVEDSFRKQGHSGFSASYCFTYLNGLISNYEETMNKLNYMLSIDNDELQKIVTDNILEIYNLIKDLPLENQEAIIKLLEGKPLTPLMGTEDEWELNEFLSSDEPYKVYNNKRCSKVTKYVMPDGIEICTYLNERIFSDNGGYTHFTTGRFGRRQITFPFEVPEKPEVVYLYEVEGRTPFILTDPNTIAQVKENYLKEEEGGKHSW